jgi:Putative auto-transporter adhesin, head GIN domain
VEVDNIETKASGSGCVELSGHAASSMVHVSGSGNFSAPNLNAMSTTVHVGGSGNAVVNSTQKLDAFVSGSGNISYNKGAQNVSISISGSGKITQY